MNNFNIAGYLYDEEVYCEDCVPSLLADPIFISLEVDFPLHCNQCQELIRTQLTNIGKEYVSNKIYSYYNEKNSKSLSSTIYEWSLEWTELRKNYE